MVKVKRHKRILRDVLRMKKGPGQTKHAGDFVDILDEFHAAGSGDEEDLIQFMEKEFPNAPQTVKDMALKEHFRMEKKGPAQTKPMGEKIKPDIEEFFSNISGTKVPESLRSLMKSGDVKKAGSYDWDSDPDFEEENKTELLDAVNKIKRRGYKKVYAGTENFADGTKIHFFGSNVDLGKRGSKTKTNFEMNDEKDINSLLNWIERVHAGED